MRLELILLLSLCLGKLATSIYNPYYYNYVYENGVLYSVGTCISPQYYRYSDYYTVSVAYECISSSHLRKHIFYSYGDTYCRDGDEGTTVDYYSSSSSSLSFYCAGTDHAAMWYNYTYQAGSKYYSCPSSYVSYYQINSTVTDVCVPHGTKANWYYKWSCDSGYLVYYETYGDSSCYSEYNSRNYYGSYCNISSSCSSSNVYNTIGYKYNSLSAAAAAVIIGVVVGVVCFFVCLSIVCWCTGAFTRINRSIFGPVVVVGPKTTTAVVMAPTTSTTTTQKTVVNVNVQPQTQQPQPGVVTPQYSMQPQYVTPQYGTPGIPQYQTPQYQTPQYQNQQQYQVPQYGNQYYPQQQQPVQYQVSGQSQPYNYATPSAPGVENNSTYPTYSQVSAEPGTETEGQTTNQ